MDSTPAPASRDIPQESVLARLINEVKNGDNWGDSDEPVEHWFRALQSISSMILAAGMAGPQIGPERGDIFSQCANVLYTIRVILPTHPDYQVFTADPLVRTKVDTDARRLFEYLKVLKMEILNYAPIRDPNQILEDEEAWNVLIRDLKFEDKAETIAKDEIYTPPEGSNLEDLSLASYSVSQALESTPSQNEPGIIPDVPPSPRSYWIDLHPIEVAGHEHGCISEEPPVPLSHWIDLRPIEDYKGLVPEVAPEPTSMFLDLHPLDDSSIPEISPFPAEFMLELHESHESQVHQVVRSSPPTTLL